MDAFYCNIFHVAIIFGETCGIVDQVCNTFDKSGMVCGLKFSDAGSDVGFLGKILYLVFITLHSVELAPAVLGKKL